jgi:hypothetical protein
MDDIIDDGKQVTIYWQRLSFETVFSMCWSIAPLGGWVYVCLTQQLAHYTTGDIVLRVGLGAFAVLWFYIGHSMRPFLSCIVYKIDPAGVTETKSFFGIKKRRSYSRSDLRYLRITELDRPRFHNYILSLVFSSAKDAPVFIHNDLAYLKEIRERLRQVLDMPESALSPADKGGQG